MQHRVVVANQIDSGKKQEDDSKPLMGKDRLCEVLGTQNSILCTQDCTQNSILCTHRYPELNSVYPELTAVYPELNSVYPELTGVCPVLSSVCPLPNSGYAELYPSP